MLTLCEWLFRSVHPHSKVNICTENENDVTSMKVEGLCCVFMSWVLFYIMGRVLHRSYLEWWLETPVQIFTSSPITKHSCVCVCVCEREKDNFMLRDIQKWKFCHSFLSKPMWKSEERKSHKILEQHDYG